MSDEAENLEVEENEELTPEQESSEFEASFNEQANERDGISNEPGDGIDPDKPSEDAPGDAEAAANADDKPTDDGEKEFEGWPQEAIDRYKSQQEQTEQLTHQLKSDNGRVSAFQIKVNDLTKQIESLQAGGGDQPSKEDIAEAMSTDEGWTKFTEDYPDIAKVIDKRFEVQQSQVDEKLAPVLEKAEQDLVNEQEATEQEAYGEIAKAFPLWQNETQSEAKKQEFRDWMAAQPPGIRALADSHDVRDASELIGKYDDYRVSVDLPSLRAVPESDGGDKEVVVDKLAERRTQQLEDGTTLPSKSSRVDPNAESGDDFENAFNAFAARKTAANSRN